MAKHGKAYVEAKKRVDREREYSPAEAVALLTAYPALEWLVLGGRDHAAVECGEALAVREHDAEAGVGGAWVDAEQFDGFELLDLPSEEPASRSERVADQECCDHSCFFSQDPRTAEAARVLRSDDRFIRAAKSRSRRDLL